MARRNRKKQYNSISVGDGRVEDKKERDKRRWRKLLLDTGTEERFLGE